MIDEVLLDLLHIELVNTLVTPSSNKSELNVTELENVGHSTGYRLIERITKDSHRFKDELDIMKFICKDFWSVIFKKQIDNLRTNHQGIYVLLDHRFRFISNISSSKQFIELMPKYLAFSCGLIRGALGNLGFNAIVTGEVVKPPSCRFQVQINKT
ncbi:trafficking protein particle complex subunit 6B [Tetranychus urticae]|uniref:Trafficking protein particle complex subunit 6B n=1 Tax=Tetranychus urticae TaxID=32264 RepID=T1JVG1_TETUR|nr:trafficking protein particle complex subunit 6B [Tetranychus urticae]XP_025018571.1 trafficking protein particle complex subunit 6B [Tetranychus urticae]